MDMTFRFTQVAEERKEEWIAVCQHLQLIILKRQREILVDKQIDDGSIGLWQLQTILFDKAQHRSFGEKIKASLADKSFLTGIHPEEEIEDKSDDRHKEHHHPPRHCLSGLTVVHHDSNHQHRDEHPIEEYAYNR